MFSLCPRVQLPNTAELIIRLLLKKEMLLKKKKKKEDIHCLGASKKDMQSITVSTA